MLLTHDLAIQEMFPDHDSIYACRFLERQKGKTTRTTSSIAHDGACIDFTKLRKVIPERLYNERLFFSTTGQGNYSDDVCTICCVPVETANEHFARE
jgi:hypothetical protein